MKNAHHLNYFNLNLLATPGVLYLGAITKAKSDRMLYVDAQRISENLQPEKSGLGSDQH